MARIKAQEKAILDRDKARQHKQHNRRLILLGTLAEKYLGENISIENFEGILKDVKQSNQQLT